MAPMLSRGRRTTRLTTASSSTTLEVTSPPQPTAAVSKPAPAPSGGNRGGRHGGRGGRGGKRSSSSSWQERCVTEEKIIDCEEDDEAAVSGSNDDDEEDRAGRRGGGGGRGRSRARRQGRQHQAAVALSTLEEESEEAVRQKEEADERELDLRIGQKLAEFDRAHWMGALQQARRLSPAQVAKELRELPLPQARIRRFAKAECTEPSQTVHQEVHLLLSKACAMLIDDLAARGWVVATESSRKCLQRCDIVTGRCKSDMFDFLVDVLPECLRLIKSKRGLNRSRAYQEMARLGQQGCLLPTAALPSLPFPPFCPPDAFPQQQAAGASDGHGLPPFVCIPYQHDGHHGPPPPLPLPPPFLMDPHALPMPPFTPDTTTGGFFPAPNGRRPGAGDEEEGKEEEDEGAMLMPLPCPSPPTLPNLHGDACMHFPSPVHRRRLLCTPDSPLPLPDEHAPHFLASSPTTSSSPFSASSTAPSRAEAGPASSSSTRIQQQARLPSPRIVSPMATTSTLLSLRLSPVLSSSLAAASSLSFDSACQTHAQSPSGQLVELALAAKAVGGLKAAAAPTGVGRIVGELEECGEAEREGAEGVLLLATKRRRKGL